MISLTSPLTSAPYKRPETFSKNEDKLIREHVKLYGETEATWNNLAKTLGRKNPYYIMVRYKYYLKGDPKVEGRFSPEEDRIILEYIEKNGKSSAAFQSLTHLLGRIARYSVVQTRHDNLVSGNVRKPRSWKLEEQKVLLKHVFKIKDIKPYDIKSLTLGPGKFADVSIHLNRTQSSCYKQWVDKVCPILKTFIKGLPFDCEWKITVIRYIVDNKIENEKELSLIAEELCPGQTKSSVSHFVNSISYKNVNGKRKKSELPLWKKLSDGESVQAIISLKDGKRGQRKLQNDNLLIEYYESFIE